MSKTLVDVCNSINNHRSVGTERATIFKRRKAIPVEGGMSLGEIGNVELRSNCKDLLREIVPWTAKHQGIRKR